MKVTAKFFLSFVVLAILCGSGSCSKEEEVRMPDNILGVWQLTPDYYFQFRDDNVSKEFLIDHQDGESIGKWSWDNVFYYEPGYNIVIYITSEHEANVYQVTELTQDKLTWCWVDEINAKDTNGVGSIIGEIINKAQEGFELNPELYETFTRIPEDEFLDILDNLDYILNPWEWE